MMPLNESRRKTYGRTILWIGISAVVSWAAGLAFHIQTPLFPFSIGVVGAAWSGGLEGGLFATALSDLILFGVFRGNMFTVLAVRPGIPLMVGFSAVSVLSSFIADRAARGYAEAKATKAELQTALERLSETNRSLEQFANSAADALRTPLRAISVFAELLQARHAALLDNESKEYLRIMLNSTSQMYGVIDGLRDYARARQSQNALLFIDANAVLRQAIQQLQAEIIAADARISHDDLPTVRADEGGLLQVMQHLLSNALKYRSAAPPEIHVSAKREGAEWVFAMSDNGIGMNPDDGKSVFDLFQRVNGDGDARNGIGLALCRATLERFGGRIWVESQAGSGSTFYFSVPAGAALTRTASA
jgi:light-regulated signal transduction histidine kinase (bacteriophytochrome)